MSISRRSLFPLAGIAVTGITPADAAPQYDPASHGLMLRIQWSYGKWVVPTPDFDCMDEMGWKPGMAIPWKHVELSEYLKQVEVACGIRKS